MNKLNSLNCKKVLLATTVLLSTTYTTHAEFIDKLNNTDNFRLFNSTISLANDDGTILLARPEGNTKAVIADWQIGNKNFIPFEISPKQDMIVVIPKARYNNGWYSINIRLFDSKKALLGEPKWINATGSVKPQILKSLTVFAKKKGFKNAKYFILRFRFGPWDKKLRGMIFDEIRLLKSIPKK